MRAKWSSMVDRKSSAGSGSRVRLSPVGGANSLSPGDYDTRRRLSAPCSTASNGSQVEKKKNFVNIVET